ncbi:hypothetical protein FRC04_010538 [Tulasnella sp. 424]|nr:hypothetical protein FRC04_010538 [Tulasnella sp. 424]
MPKLNREEVDVTSSLKNILDNYPAGSATLREFLQNTDDAGAKTQTFILHNHKFSSTDLVGGELASCQGPAIIATNNAYFKEKDWKAITTILNSSKTQDETSTGKYGLGFRSCYHITDNPHILSHDKLLILDPHARVEKFPGGFELNTKRTPNDEGKIEREVYKDHFSTFSAVLKPDADVYPGTAIRLPLRLPGSQSKLKSTPTRVEDARKMFDDFVTKELPEAMLFLKNIREIKLIEIDENDAETVIATATLEKSDIVGSHSGEGRVKREETSHHRVTITLRIGTALPVARSWIITQFVEKYATASGHMAKRLKRTQNDVEEDMSKDKLVPHVALALPIPQNDASAIPDPHGKLFTLLPLPISTNFPVHINAVLALVSSRQNLRNSMDVEAGSREEFLVEWNRVIFSEFAPKAWAALLDHLVAQQSGAPSVVRSSTINVFEAWPGLVASQDGDQGYWYPLPSRLLEEAACKAVWPLRGKESQFSTLSDVLVAAEGEKVAPLAALEMCNVPLVVVPQRVFNLIETSEFKKAILTPETAYPYIKKNSRTLSDLDAATRKSICDWLVSASDIRLILDLPIIPQVQNKHTSITSHGKYTMATESEAAIFSTVDQNLLAEALMSPPTRELLLSDPARRVRPVGPAEVARYLENRVPTFDGMTLANISTGVKLATFEWLIKFWSWLDGWEKFDELVNDSPAWSTIQNLHALPLRLSGGRPALRLVGKSAVRSGGLDAEVVAGLTALEVPMLEGSMSTGSAVQYVSKNHSDVAFILQSLPKNKPFTHLNQASRQTLHEFFTEQLSNYLRPGPRARQRVTLSADSRNALRTLPIFPIFSPGRRDDSSMTFDVAPEGACFVDNSVQVIPSIRGAPFVSHDQGRVLHTALEERSVFGEIDVLRKAIGADTWSQQDQVAGLLSALVDRLLSRLNELGAPTRSRIGELPIVEVGGRRQSPNQVVDPSSGLAGLYDAEDEVLPVGQFAREGAGSYISQLRNYGMIRTTLTPAAIKERVDRIANQSRPMKDRAEKGLRLLKLLGSYTQPGGHKLPPEIVGVLVRSTWLPAADAFYTPSQCWDSRMKDAMLCDLVLPRIPVTVNTQYLRDSFGWTRVPFGVLQSQLLKVLETTANSSEISPTDSLDRIEAVLKELASEWQARRISQEDIMSLVEALEDVAWVPTISRSRCAARRAMLEQIDLGMKYHLVTPSLLNFVGMEALLKQMGINSRPTQASLFSTLREISTELSEADLALRTRDGLVRTSVLILEEICRSMEGKDSEFQRILVPTESWQLAPAPEVLFNDMGGDPTSSPPGFQFAHPQVSAELANNLGLRRLGEEEFSDGGDGIQSFHMGEDLTIRIRGVLQDYDIDHSSNEWVANADDAGASSVTFLVDEASFQGRRVISGLNVFQSGPALVVHNDGIFTDADFQGLISVGRGGKSGRVDSIGRFGLGALSFYHFSELPWIISGKHCLFLDPSEEYLPRERGNVKRSGALVTLSFCKSRYPDQLKPLEGLFGFSSKDEAYNGTLFRFPLRTAVQAECSKLSDTHFSPVDIANKINRFYAYASHSLFFTKSLAQITAVRRTADHKFLSIWSVQSSAEPISQETRSEIAASEVSLLLKAPQTLNVIRERWLVTRSQAAKEEFPARFQPVFSHHRLPNPTFGLAINLSAKGSIPNSRLFATLPLPVSTSLPVHIHATWILAQDRRSIRYDAPDAADQRPLDTLYNEHILENGISPLYLKTLALVLLHHPKLARQFWPKKAQDGPSRVVAAEIHKQIISTQESILLSAQNQPITPSQAIIHLSRKAPQAVRKILTELQIPNYVPYPYFDTSFLEDWGGLRFDSAKEVSAILRQHATTVKKLWQDNDHVNPSYSASAFNSKDVISILDYLAKEGQSLDGIPLLLRGDRQLVEFQSSRHRKIFASHREDLTKLFGASAVVSQDFSEVDEGLVKLNVNVGILDSQGMRDLLAHHINAVAPADARTAGNAERKWHIELLRFLASPVCPVRLEDVADLPLLPIFGRDIVVSLNYAKSGKIWWKSPFEDPALTTILLQLDVIEVDNLPGGMQAVEMVDLGRILRLFGQLGLSSAQILQKVTTKDWNAFIQYIKLWLQGPYIDRLSAAEFQTLMTLPLFSGRQGMKQVPFVSASQVLMFPDSVPLDDLARYLPPGIIFAAYSRDLAVIFGRGKNAKKHLSFANLLSRLRIPSQLSQDEDTSFSSLLQLIARYHVGPYNNQLIPDGNRVLRRPTELFDHRVDLFSTAFEGQDELFVHPNFRGLIDRFVDLGIQHNVTPQNLLRCIQAVDRDARQGQEPVRRATWLWDYVNTAPPPLRQITFGAIRGLRFLPRHTQRHPSDYDFDVYARNLPNVVSLDELCAPEREAVVWTQRARFSTSPTPHLKAIYPNVGEPTPDDVVRHLVSLVNNVAPKHHQSSTVLSNIRSVYGWLKNNKEEVKTRLGALSKQPLWLNINSILDEWTWRSADELVFDLSHDVEASRRFVVRKFLLSHRSLLVDVGAHEFRVASPSLPKTSETRMTHLEMVRSGWNDLREAGQLLDICFIVQKQQIQAHRGMLAAMIPHFKTAFAGSFRESLVFADDTDIPIYPLPEEEAASAFAVQSVVDYVYTGAFKRPAFTAPDDVTAALDDLLDLMELANLWDISELANQAVQAILDPELRLIQFDNCDDRRRNSRISGRKRVKVNAPIFEIPDPPEEFGQDGGKFYRAYNALAEEIDDDMTKSLKEQLDGMLIFAGLFGGVNSAFLALTLPLMSADPADDTNALLAQNNAILLQFVSGRNDTTSLDSTLPSASFAPSGAVLSVNVLFALSLAFAIISSFLAVLGRQWLVYYRKRGGGGPDRQRWEQLKRFLGAERCSVRSTVLSHIFFVGFLAYHHGY